MNTHFHQLMKFKSMFMLYEWGMKVWLCWIWASPCDIFIKYKSYTIIKQRMAWNKKQNNQVTETFTTGKSVYVLSRVTEVLRSAIHWIQIHRSAFCCLILITGTNFVEWLGCFSQTRALWHWISNQRYKSTDSRSSNRSLSPGCEQTFKPLQSKVSTPPSRSTNHTIHRGQRHLEVQCVNDVDWWFKEVEPHHQMENSPVCVVNSILCQMHENHRSSLGSLEEGGWVN